MRRCYSLLTLLLLGAPVAAQPLFTEVTAGDLLTPVVSWGASWVDADGDGDLDLFASRLGLSGGNVLFLNSGGAFTLAEAGDLTDPSTPGSHGNTWADYDNDGDLDVYVAGGGASGASRLFRNVGGRFTLVDDAPVAPADDNRGWAAAWGDYDNDGWLDLVVAHPAGFVGFPSQENHLFRNGGDGTFTRVTDGPIVTGTDPYTVPSWSDYDLDGDADLFIGSGPANGTTAPDNLYENLGDGLFERITTDPIATDDRNGQVMNWIDYDNDGDLDLFVTNYGTVTNDFYRNDGGGVYTRLTDGPLVTDLTGPSLANTWGDLDNDGDLDVIVANARTTADDGQNNLYLNNGDGTFTRVEGTPFTTLQESTSGATLGDYDDDGDLDLVTTDPPPATTSNLRLWRNDTDGANAWVKVNLRGRDSNRSGIGAIVRATAVIDGASRTQLREVSAQNTFNGQNSLTVHVGLGDATAVDEIEITWPSGQVDTHAALAVNTTYNAVEGQGIAPVANEPGAPEGDVTALAPPTPNPSARATTLRYTLAAPSAVRLAVYDVLGRAVAVLVDGAQPAGAHEVRFDGAGLPGGVYLVGLTHPGGVATRPITLLR